MSTDFTHVDERRQPAMVDVGGKAVTHRTAVAEARVRFPGPVAEALRESGFETSKGPVYHTAIVAGVMAAKRTRELIPFCHPLGIENCRIEIDMDAHDSAVIHCTVSVHHRTGVEMEALTGATIAALTVYDMVKSLGKEVSIGPIRLLEREGGRSLGSMEERRAGPWDALKRCASASGVAAAKPPVPASASSRAQG